MAIHSKKLLVVLAVALSGCSQLPLNGPAYRDITSGASVHVANDRRAIAQEYVLVDVDSPVLENLAAIQTATFDRSFIARYQHPPKVNVGVGDVLQVSVFESGTGGLFQPSDNIPRPTNFVTLPLQTVDGSGAITVPYAGRIQVSGRGVSEVESVITKKLVSRAVEPQVMVTIAEQNAASVTVLGDTLNSANRIKISGSERILDVISKAGGTKFPGYELFVTVQRGTRRGTVHFPTLVNNPASNIYVAPGDTIYVYRKLEKFVALGALGSTGQTQGLTGQFAFDQEQLSLTEAIAKAGGLQDTRANPAQVFLYRMEQRDLLDRIGIELIHFSPDQQFIPTIYRVNFRDPSGFFTAQKFRMRDRDVIYAANADSTEVVKFLEYARAVTSTVAGVTGDGRLTSDIVGGRHILGN